METVPSEIYRRLQQHLDRMPVGFPATESGVEIRLLERLFSPEEAAIAVELSAIPERAATIHRRFGKRMTPQALKAALKTMARRGVILALTGKDGVRYAKLAFAVGIYERQLNCLTPEFESDVRQYFEEAFGRAWHSRKTTQMRVVPVHKPIPLERPVARYDDIREYVRSSPGPFARQPCICRKGKALLGEKCAQTSRVESCLTVGRGARLMAQASGATMVSREEMLALLEEAEKDGLVLQTENTQNPLYICCCCHCCCGVLTSARRLERPADYFSSNFTVSVDPEACQACGTCAVRCQVEAIAVDGGDGKARLDESRCIGCALCVETCPSNAIRLEPRKAARVPPNDTQALYLRILRDRYGPWAVLGLGARKLLGIKF